MRLPFGVVSIAEAATNKSEAGHVEVGVPRRKIIGGMEKYAVTVDGKTKDIAVAVNTAKGDPIDKIEKTKRIVIAINKKFPGAATQDKDNNGNLIASLTITGKNPTDPEGFTFSKNKPDTNSREKINEQAIPISFDSSAGPTSVGYSLIGEIRYLDDPSGIDDVGGESIFNISFGYDGLLVDSNLSFSDFGGGGVNDLLNAAYNELAADLPDNLLTHLDLNLDTSVITFIFPALQSNYFISESTTDTIVLSEAGLRFIPEPDALSLMLLGFACLIIVQCSVKRQTT